MGEKDVFEGNLIKVWKSRSDTVSSVQGQELPTRWSNDRARVMN